MQIESINLGRKLAIVTGNEIVPITTMFDEFGDETDEPSEARQFVVGPTKEGKWLSDDASEFEFNAQVH